MTTAHLAAAATMPYALSAVAGHMIDHDLPAESVETRTGEVHIWVLAADAPAWMSTSIDITGRDVQLGTGPWHSHTAHGILHGSCVKVRLRWTTRLDHETCRSHDAACTLIICYCPTHTPCPGTVEAGCDHAAGFVCDTHRASCTDCRIDMAGDRGLTGIGGR